MLNAKSVMSCTRRWSLRLLVVVVLAIGLQMTVLAFPQILMTKNVSAGAVTIYFDEGSPSDILTIAKEVDFRVRGSDFFDSAGTSRVFLMSDQQLFALFARLSLVQPQVQGFGLSIFGNSFVNVHRVELLGQHSGGQPNYSIFEGSVAHIIAHEIAHHYIVDRIGRKAWLDLPHWKQEGLPEYIANIAAIRTGQQADLVDRYRILTTDSVWHYQRGWDRIHYEAEILVEFLLDRRGYTLDDLTADSVTAQQTMRDLLVWSDDQRNHKL